MAAIDSSEKAGPDTEKYGPRSGYGFLRTVRRPIRIQDSPKSYNKTSPRFHQNQMII